MSDLNPKVMQGLAGLAKELAGQPDEVASIGRYRLLRKVGEGSAGTVFEAEDTTLRRRVAVKILRGGLELKPDVRHRFDREARVMASLTHPNLTRVHDVGVEAGRPYLVIEFIDGKPLHRFQEGREKSFQGIAELVEKIARGVGAAHEKGIVHRDLKPGNILVTPAGEPKVTDFGLARVLGATTALTRTGSVLGTPLYMAPEQVRGLVSQVSPRTDVYALGAILYEALTGRVPHLATTPAGLYAQIALQDPVAPRNIDLRIPAALECICLRALEKNPRNRYESGGALADDLGRFLRGEAVLAKGGKWRRGIVWMAGTILLMGIMAWGASLAIDRRPNSPNSPKGNASIEETSRGKSERTQRVQLLLFQGRELVSQADRLRVTDGWGKPSVLSFLDQAEKKYREVLTASPEHPEALLELARLARKQSDEDEAIRFCDRAIAADARLTSAYLERAFLRLEKLYHRFLLMSRRKSGMEPEEVDLRASIEEDLAQARQRFPQGQDLETADALWALCDGRFAEAAERLEARARVSVADEALWAWAAIAWDRSDRAEDAHRCLDEAIKYNPSNVYYMFLRGVVMKKRGNEEGALREFYQVLEIDPKYPEVRLLKASTLQKLDRPQEAIQSWTEILHQDPTNVEAYFHRAACSASIGDLKGALKDYDEVIQRSPEDDMAWHNRGFTRYEMGDLELAERDISRSIELNPDCSQAYVNRSLISITQASRVGAQARSLWESAIQDCTLAIALDPKQKWAWNNRATARLEMGQDSAALADANQAIQLDEGLAEAYTTRANIYLRVKREEEAIQDYKKALDLGGPHWPHRSWVERNLARLEGD